MASLESLTSSPSYQQLIETRARIIWPLLWLTVASYVGFILAIAFAPASLGTPFFGSAVSVGIVLGLALIFLNFVITFLYVRRANHTLEPLIAQLQQQYAGE
jgi:uncharacterized membrane protein (DUF485 family)